MIRVNGRSAMVRTKDFSSMESDHVWLYYCSRGGHFGVEMLLQNDWSHFQVCVKAKKGSIKKCGFRLICEQKEDDLRVMFPAPKQYEGILGGLHNKIIQQTPRKKILQLKQMQRKAYHL
ncbi:hypothetical protein EUGRSUZ_E03098 [Eucalyptus grandis]|uniref:Uncharacterized protein n=2 Tax=Eucalyptus grandis TaxID=71139 RepID=A0ACC3KZJ0_EUCGR|nr:hypothetical protein EUGRSUZ_E03098 [Eucalyptus grandis]